MGPSAPGPAEGPQQHVAQEQQLLGPQHHVENEASGEPKQRAVYNAAASKTYAVISLRTAMQAVHEQNQSKHVKTRVKRLDKETKVSICGQSLS